MSSLLKQFPAGRLFVWGSILPKAPPTQQTLPEKIIKCSVGPEHIVAIGQSGNLYSMGSGKYGKLGLGDTKDKSKFTLVEYFQKHDIKVKDAVCGQSHTIVLSQKGEVYTFGYGGKKSNFIMNIFSNNIGPLGHGDNTLQEVTKPAKVKALQNENIVRISAGRHFNMVFNDKKQVFNWGNGQYGAFGNGQNKNHNVPVKNQHFQYLYKQENLHLLKVKSCESYSMALMDNGKLYGWGSNEHGQMGIKSEIGIQMYQTVNYVTEAIREGFQNQKVINFDISDNLCLFQLDNNQIWWSGMKIAYKPEKVHLASSMPKLFAAGSRSFAIVTPQNDIYIKNKFIDLKGKVDPASDLQKINGTQLFKGQLVGIGGQYSSRYAIVL